MNGANRVIWQRYRRRVRQEQKRRQVWRRGGSCLAVVFAGFVGLIGLGVAGATAVYLLLLRDLPNLTQLEQQPQLAGAPGSQIYAANGRLIDEITAPPSQWLPLTQLPQPLQDATVAYEEPAFWQDSQLNWAELSQSWLQAARQEPPGSRHAIARHLVGTLLPPRDPTTATPFDRWRHEAQTLWLMQQLLAGYSPEQILAWHLNSRYYGNLAYGVEAATQLYLGKTAVDLALPEATLIAVAGSRTNPLDTPAEARQQQMALLEQMAAAGLISLETAVAAKDVPLAIAARSATQPNLIAPHFARQVRQELLARFGPERVLRDGLRVYTTIDLAWQQQAECLAQIHITRLSGQTEATLPPDLRAGCAALAHLAPQRTAELGVDRHVNNAAIVALDPRSGEIRALVGSLNYWDNAHNGSVNAAYDVLHQPGSLLLPFVYLTVLSQGYSAATMLLDVGNDGTALASAMPIQNEDGLFHGPLRLRQAMANGYHVPAVQALSWVGVERLLRTAHNLGLTSLEPLAASDGFSLLLNGGGVRLLDVAYAFGVMGNRGVMVGQPGIDGEQRPLDPVIILRVEDRSGRILYEYNQPAQRDILTPELAYLMNDILSDRSARCPAFGCPNGLELPNNRPAAVKTGHSQDGRDVWTIGYTPEMVVGVWLGNHDNSPTDRLTGLEGAAPIWQALLGWGLAQQPLAQWPRPAGLHEMTVCETSGLLPTPYCPTVPELFIAGTEPIAPDTIYQQVAINRENGRLATSYTPPELVEQQIFKIYPPAAANWARAQAIPQPPDEYDTITTLPTDGTVAITAPQPFATISGQVPVKGLIQQSGLAFYRLAYYQGLYPHTLVTIAEVVGPAAATNGTLAVWATTGLADGLYTLLLTAVTQDGRFTEANIHVTVANPGS